MCERKRPFFTGTPSTASFSQKCSYSRSVIAGSAASEKPGRLPFLHSAARVNWLIASASPAEP
jgi:hypothetical protein